MYRNKLNINDFYDINKSYSVNDLENEDLSFAKKDSDPKISRT